MYKIFVAIVILLFINGCSTHTSQLNPNHTNKALFAQEDYYILVALHAEELHEYSSASKLFFILYEKTKRKEYIYRDLENALLAKEYKNVIKKVDKLVADGEDDSNILRSRIFAYVQLHLVDKAKQFALELLQSSQEDENYLLLSDILEIQQNYKDALSYLNEGYKHNYNDKIIQKITMIMYEKYSKKAQAIEMLERHTQINSCFKSSCLLLALF